MGKLLVQTPFAAQPGLGAQPSHEVSGDLWVIYGVNATINIRLKMLLTNSGPKLAMGQPNNS